jgi:hypothetical protein
MRRRECFAGLGAAAWPLAVWAQQPKTAVIGFLSEALASAIENTPRKLFAGVLAQNPFTATPFVVAGIASAYLLPAMKINLHPLEFVVPRSTC